MKVNGKTVAIQGRQSLHDFLEANNYKSALVAVERNGEIVPRSAYRDVWLTDDDTLEIVCFVGGG